MIIKAGRNLGPNESHKQGMEQGKDAFLSLGLTVAESEQIANGTTKPCPSWMLSNIYRHDTRIFRKEIEHIDSPAA